MKTQNNLQDLPLYLLGGYFNDLDGSIEQISEITNSFASNYALNKKEWFIPQAQARLAELPLLKDEFGLFSPRELFSAIRSDASLLGIFCLFMFADRSKILVGKQYVNTEHCLLVPLVLAAFKRYQNINYSKWPRKGNLGLLVPKNLTDLMLYTPVEHEEDPRPWRSEMSKAVRTSYSANWPLKHPLKGDANVPVLYKFIYAQLWAAHPGNRSPYMILDCLDWDNMPAPIVESEVFRPAPKDIVWPSSKKAIIVWPPSKKTSSDVPWL